MTVDTAPALSMSGVTKRFGPVLALDAVDFAVERGSVHALLGENGAGKTTLMRVAFGLVTPDSGAVSFFGARSHARVDARTARSAGVGMVQQHHALTPTLTASENIGVGGRGVFRPRAARRALDALMASSGLRVDPDVPVRDLSIVERQRVEILKALARNARILILDEPTPGLAPSEIDDLLAWVRQFAAGGGSVVLVTHKLREARAVADRFTVMWRGRVVLHESADAVTNETVANAMFPGGHPGEVPVIDAKAVHPPAEVVQAAGISVADDRGIMRIHSGQFAVRRGEIVGLAAVEGSGHRDLLAALAGLRGVSQGTLALPARIAVIPGDRHRDALISGFSLAENVALRGAGDRRGLMPWRDLEKRTAGVIDRFGIAAGGPRVPAATLSGGNQQRLVVARELEQPVDLVIADNPTRGLDLRAVAFVHEQLRRAAAGGAAVVVHSSDIDELFTLATRMVVVFHGSIHEVPLERDAVARAMIGA